MYSASGRERERVIGGREFQVGERGKRVIGGRE